jgi:putative DNA primase/helicase
MVENLHESEQIKAAKRQSKKGKERNILRPAPFAKHFVDEQRKVGTDWRFSVSRGLFYRCDTLLGPWRAIDVVYLQKEVRKALIDMDEAWDTMYSVNEVVNALKELLADPVNDDIFDVGKHPDLIHIYVNNGMLDWRTGTLKPWDSSTYSTIKLPVDWDPQAVNSDAYKTWISTLEEWVPEQETRDFLQEYVGYCLIPDCSFRTAVFLYGGGSNGKSLFLEVVSKLFGDHISFLPLHRIAERFQTAYLMDKLINVCGDIDAKYLDETSVLKAMIAGDPIRGEFKHGKSFDFYPVSRLMFSANKLPQVADKSEGWYSRWKFVEFPRRFKTNPLYKRNLLSTMSTPNALSGVLCWAIEGLRRLYESGEFAVSEPMKTAELQYRSENDSVMAFSDFALTQTAHDGARTTLTIPSLYAVYKMWCDDVGVRAVSRMEFTKRLSNIGLDKGVRTVDGPSTNCFLGVIFSNAATDAGYHEEYGFHEAIRSSTRKRNVSPKIAPVRDASG